MNYKDIQELKMLKTKEEKINFLAWRYLISYQEAEELFKFLRRDLV